MNKVAIISSEFPPGPGGIGKHAQDLALGLIHKGFVVNVYASVDYVSKDQVGAYQNELPKHLNLFPFKRVKYFTVLLRILKVLREIKPSNTQSVIVTGKFSLWLGGLLKFFYGKSLKVIAFAHGSEIKLKNKTLRYITSRSLKTFDEIYAVSDFTKSLLPNAILSSKSVKILPNGIHPNEWNTPNVRGFNWEGFPQILTVGNVTPRKGQHRVIAALPTLIKKWPNIHYHIVGLPSTKAQLTQLILELGVEKHVTFHGRLKDSTELQKAYKSADIFSMLSENQDNGDVEGFGIAILEANIHGVPAIGALGCGIEDAIEEGVNGYLVDGNNPQMISDKIEKILSEKEKLKKSSIAFAKQHDWDIIVDRLIKESLN